MRQVLLTTLLAIMIPACSSPETPGPSDGGSGVDGFPGDVDSGSDMDVGPDGSIALESGELVTDFSEFDEPTDVVLRDAGEFLFLFADGEELAWMRKDNGMLVTFATWPDVAHPEASRASRDFVHDDERVWFLAEMGDGTSAIVGAEHDLGNPFPFFGQPIVIIDVGPMTGPGGIAMHENRLVVEFEQSEGEPEPSIVVATEQGGVSETVRVEASNVFDRLDTGPDGVVLWTTGEPDGAKLQAFIPGQAVDTLTWPEHVPVASSTHDGGYVWGDERGRIWTRTGGDSDDVLLIEQVVEDGEINTMAAAGGVVVVATSGEIHVLEDAERTRRIDAAGEVHSLIWDSSSIFWSTTQGVYRYDVAR